MRSYEPPKGPTQLLATVLFSVGLALSVFDAVIDETAWVAWTGIVLMAAGVLLSIALLLVQWRKQR